MIEKKLACFEEKNKKMNFHLLMASMSYSVLYKIVHMQNPVFKFWKFVLQRIIEISIFSSFHSFSQLDQSPRIYKA